MRREGESPLGKTAPKPADGKTGPDSATVKTTPKSTSEKSTAVKREEPEPTPHANQTKYSNLNRRGHIYDGDIPSIEDNSAARLQRNLQITSTDPEILFTTACTSTETLLFSFEEDGEMVVPIRGRDTLQISYNSEYLFMSYHPENPLFTSKFTASHSRSRFQLDVIRVLRGDRPLARGSSHHMLEKKPDGSFKLKEVTSHIITPGSAPDSNRLDHMTSFYMQEVRLFEAITIDSLGGLAEDFPFASPDQHGGKPVTVTIEYSKDSRKLRVLLSDTRYVKGNSALQEVGHMIIYDVVPEPDDVPEPDKRN